MKNFKSNRISLFFYLVAGVMHVCDRARGDCKRSPACTVYGDGNTTASLRINMLARLNDSDFCGVYINDVSAPPWPFSFFSQVRHKSHRGDFDWIQLWPMLHDTICISHLHMADRSAARSGIIEIFGEIKVVSFI